MLFTDIVDSTMTAAGQGDQSWTSLLDRHDAIARRAVGDHTGRLVKTTGDGMLATFAGPSQVIAVAAMHSAMPELGITVRAGVHVGEVEMRTDGDIAGIGVLIAARIAGLAGADETIVSRRVEDLVVGSDLRFGDLGEHHLKRVPEPWQCFVVRAAAHAAG